MENCISPNGIKLNDDPSDVQFNESNIHFHRRTELFSIRRMN